MNRYLCPVCFYPDLDEPPGEFNICPCCGTEFGVDDYSPRGISPDVIHRELRWQWVANGAPWFDPGTPQPEGWRGAEQIWRSEVWLRGTTSMSSVAASTGTRVTVSAPGEFMGARVLAVA